MTKTMQAKCNVCYSQEVKEVFCYRGLIVFKCKFCGLCFVVDESDPKILPELYEGDMYSNYWKYESGFYEKHWRKTEDHTEDIIEDLRKESQRIDKYCSRRGRLLDVGCFKGHFCKMMQDKGWKVLGIDISKEAIDFGRRNFGLELYCGQLKDVNLEKNSFDVVTLLGVIEHLKDPRAVIKQVADLTKRNGLLVIKTQNQNSLLSFCAFLLYKVTLGKVNSHLDFFYSREHLYRFNPYNLCLLLKSEGFKIAGISYDSANIVKFALKTAKFYIKFPAMILELIAKFLHWQDKISVYAVKI